MTLTERVLAIQALLQKLQIRSTDLNWAPLSTAAEMQGVLVQVTKELSELYRVQLVVQPTTPLIGNEAKHRDFIKMMGIATKK